MKSRTTTRTQLPTAKSPGASASSISSKRKKSLTDLMRAVTKLAGSNPSLLDNLDLSKISADFLRQASYGAPRPAPAASGILGLLDLLTPEKELAAAQADINNAWTKLCELARTRDIPHEVFDLLGDLREKTAHEFQWFEKVPALRPQAMSIERAKDIARQIISL